MQIRQFVDEGLGNSTHLVISARTGVAALVDPLRDVDRYLEAARVEGVRITHVLETHVHNDFVSGGRELAAPAGTLADGGLVLPADRPIAAHCGHDARATTGLSLLERAGYHDQRLISGGFEAWEAAGLPVERGEASHRQEARV